MKKSAIITTSWDDGHPLDLKLAKLLRRYGVPATFYVSISNPKRECMDVSQIREIAGSFDIGGHSVHHYDLTKLPVSVAEREVFQCKERLELITGMELRMFCYPKGGYNNNLIDITKRAGFIGARTMSLFETAVKNPFKLGTTVQSCDLPRLYYTKEFMKSRNHRLFRFVADCLPNKVFFDWEEIAVATMKYVRRIGGIWHLWGHSWEIEKNNDWERLEKLFRTIKTVVETDEVSLMDNSQLMSR